MHGRALFNLKAKSRISYCFLLRSHSYPKLNPLSIALHTRFPNLGQLYKCMLAKIAIIRVTAAWCKGLSSRVAKCTWLDWNLPWTPDAWSTVQYTVRGDLQPWANWISIWPWIKLHVTLEHIPSLAGATSPRVGGKKEFPSDSGVMVEYVEGLRYSCVRLSRILIFPRKKYQTMYQLEAIGKANYWRHETVVILNLQPFEQSCAAVRVWQ